MLAYENWGWGGRQVCFRIAACVVQATAFAELNAPPVIPKAFPAGDWTMTMNGWGHKVLAACQTAAEMLVTMCP